jgi:uncharacterized membrane protein
MAKFEISTVINSPIDIVYQAFVDTDNMLKWTKDLEKIEIVKGKFGEIGSAMQLHYNKKGRKSILQDTLEYIDPKRKIKSRVTGGGLNASVETTFYATNDRTIITMLWNGKGNNIIVTTILSILKNKIKREAQSELNLFRELVEKYGVKFK